MSGSTWSVVVNTFMEGRGVYLVFFYGFFNLLFLDFFNFPKILSYRNFLLFLNFLLFNSFNSN